MGRTLKHGPRFGKHGMVGYKNFALGTHKALAGIQKHDQAGEGPRAQRFEVRLSSGPQRTLVAILCKTCGWTRDYSTTGSVGRKTILSMKRHDCIIL